MGEFTQPSCLDQYLGSLSLSCQERERLEYKVDATVCQGVEHKRVSVRNRGECCGTSSAQLSAGQPNRHTQVETSETGETKSCRFVPTCSRKLLQDLGALASSKGLHIQTHLSENKREVEWVKQLEPDCKHYTEVYKKSGLLGSRTILAHCVHLTDEEVEMVQSTGSGISHCPNSNFSLKSGVCNVQRLRRAGVKVSTCDGRFIEAVGYLDRA